MCALFNGCRLLMNIILLSINCFSNKSGLRFFRLYYIPTVVAFYSLPCGIDAIHCCRLYVDLLLSISTFKCSLVESCVISICATSSNCYINQYIRQYTLFKALNSEQMKNLHLQTDFKKTY